MRLWLRLEAISSLLCIFFVSCISDTISSLLRVFEFVRAMILKMTKTSYGLRKGEKSSSSKRKKGVAVEDEWGAKGYTVQKSLRYLHAERYTKELAKGIHDSECPGA